MILEDITVEDEIEAAREEAFEDGIEIGEARGMEKGIEKTARNALAEGLSVDVVQKITGLSREEIEKL